MKIPHQSNPKPAYILVEGKRKLVVTDGKGNAYEALDGPYIKIIDPPDIGGFNTIDQPLHIEFLTMQELKDKYGDLLTEEEYKKIEDAMDSNRQR